MQARVVAGATAARWVVRATCVKVGAVLATLMKVVPVIGGAVVVAHAAIATRRSATASAIVVNVRIISLSSQSLVWSASVDLPPHFISAV